MAIHGIRPILATTLVVLACFGVWRAPRAQTAPAAGATTRAAGPAGPAQAAGAPARARSPRNASYSIDASLDPRTRTITGRAVVTWRNVTGRPTSELRLHLYWNAFKNTRSSFLRGRLLAAAPAERQALLARPLDHFGHTTITAVRLLGAGASPPVELTSGVHAIQPDDGNPDDETLVRVPLPVQAAPGQTLNVEVEWTARVPRTFARTGVIGNYYFVAQWFPKVAVLGGEGWIARQFHASTEFFSDFGVYDVRLRVPAGWVVGATGLAQPPRDNGDGTLTHRFVQEDVHDFAWTTSPDFLERRERFEHSGLPPVDMRLLLQPEHAAQADRYFAATRAALRYYGEWFGPYPYGHVTVVDPAWQSGSGGMEYPTLFTGGTRWLAPRRVSQPEGVTVHEAGHQFWYGLIATNEFDHAWMDEGLNTFSTGRVMDELMPVRLHSERFFGGFVPWVIADVRLTRESDGNGWPRYRRDAESDVPATPSWRYWPGTAASITYSKTALWLHTLERMLGWQTLQRILSTYFERHAFGHPAPEDFFAVANEVSGRDLTWFFDEVHRSANAFDYGVERLVSSRKTVRGLVDRDGRKVAVGAEPLGDLHETQVVVRRHGEAVFPVDVLVRFEDGSEVRQRWDGRDRWRLFTFERQARAVSAEVDPDRVLLLDQSVTNNSRTLAPQGEAAATKWSLRWMVWLQDLLLTYGFFA
ncbi:MAG: M1 family metallopeptidase [Vicinamibacterales bacterium]|nr:M1 family metallopeptidase [Vicinamibacterales bacterium]